MRRTTTPANVGYTPADLAPFVGKTVTFMTVRHGTAADPHPVLDGPITGTLEAKPRSYLDPARIRDTHGQLWTPNLWHLANLTLTPDGASAVTPAH